MLRGATLLVSAACMFSMPASGMQRNPVQLPLKSSVFLEASSFSGRTPPRPIVPSDPCAEAVGRFEESVFMKGTGTLVHHPRIVATNAHIVAKDGVSKDRVPFELRDPRQGFVARWGTVVALGTTRPQAREYYADDWALVVLDEAPRNINPLGVVIATPEELQQDGETMFGYSFSRFRKLPGSGDRFATLSEHCGVKYSRWEILFHNCASMPGGSGMALLERKGNTCEMVALHTGGSGGSVEGVRESEETLNMAVLVARFKDQILAVGKLLMQGLTSYQIKRVMEARYPAP